MRAVHYISDVRSRKLAESNNDVVDVNLQTYVDLMHSIGSGGRHLRQIGNVNNKVAT